MRLASTREVGAKPRSHAERIILMILKNQLKLEPAGRGERWIVVYDFRGRVSLPSRFYRNLERLRKFFRGDIVTIQKSVVECRDWRAAAAAAYLARLYGASARIYRAPGLYRVAAEEVPAEAAGKESRTEEGRGVSAQRGGARPEGVHGAAVGGDRDSCTAEERRGRAGVRATARAPVASRDPELLRLIEEAYNDLASKYGEPVLCGNEELWGFRGLFERVNEILRKMGRRPLTWKEFRRLMQLLRDRYWQHVYVTFMIAPNGEVEPHNLAFYRPVFVKRPRIPPMEV